MIENVSEWSAIVCFNQRLIEQAIALTEDFRLNAETSFGQDCGPHLRHLVEHYESLIKAISAETESGIAAITYDRRLRDREIETCSERMRCRLESIHAALVAVTAQDPEQLCTVELCGGLEGEQVWITRSTLSRELLFLASHTTHHFALIRNKLTQQGHALHADFGKAPATKRHEINQ